MARRAPRPGRRQPGRNTKSAASVPVRETTLLIDRVGREGDGLGRDGNETIAVPYVLPGESVTASVGGRRGSPLALTGASNERVEPACTHHGCVGGGDGDGGEACGSCALQHWAAGPYEAWKRDLLVSALERVGLDVTVDALVPCPPAARRRLVLAARRTAAGTVLGFHAARSDRIVPMRECSVAVPEIVAVLPDLRALCDALIPAGAAAKVNVLATETGLDVRVDPDRQPDAAMRRAAIPLAAPFARVSLGDEVVVEQRAPVLRFGPVGVTPPPGAFVQAVAAAEDAMARLVKAHLEPCRRVVDLYAGSGAFALRLAARSAVHAVEGEAAPLTALDRAWRSGEGLRRVTTERRDLDRRPLTRAELDGMHAPGAKPFDGVVFDPPRAGAEAQVTQLARSGVERVAAVSCNPVTLARDLAVLAAGGYRIERVVPIDQFAHTPHLEAVALLTR